jgi:hypothetical protein
MMLLSRGAYDHYLQNSAGSITAVNVDLLVGQRPNDLVEIWFR